MLNPIEKVSRWRLLRFLYADLCPRRDELPADEDTSVVDDAEHPGNGDSLPFIHVEAVAFQERAAFRAVRQVIGADDGVAAPGVARLRGGERGGDLLPVEGACLLAGHYVEGKRQRISGDKEEKGDGDHIWSIGVK